MLVAQVHWAPEVKQSLYLCLQKEAFYCLLLYFIQFYSLFADSENTIEYFAKGLFDA